MLLEIPDPVCVPEQTPQIRSPSASLPWWEGPSTDNPEWESPRDAEVESLFVLPAFGLEVGERSVSQLEVHRG